MVSCKQFPERQLDNCSFSPPLISLWTKGEDGDTIALFYIITPSAHCSSFKVTQCHEVRSRHHVTDMTWQSLTFIHTFGNLKSLSKAMCMDRRRKLQLPGEKATQSQGQHPVFAQRPMQSFHLILNISHIRVITLFCCCPVSSFTMSLWFHSFGLLSQILFQAVVKISHTVNPFHTTHLATNISHTTLAATVACEAANEPDISLYPSIHSLVSGVQSVTGLEPSTC